MDFCGHQMLKSDIAAHDFLYLQPIFSISSVNAHMIKLRYMCIQRGQIHTHVRVEVSQILVADIKP